MSNFYIQEIITGQEQRIVQGDKEVSVSELLVDIANKLSELLKRTE